MSRSGRRAEREQFWRLAIEEHAQSGLSAREFCRRESISEPSFYSWRRRLSGRERLSETAVSRQASGSPASGRTTELAASGLIPVQVAGLAPRMIEVVAPAGVVVRLPEDCSVETIGRVLRALRQAGSPC